MLLCKTTILQTGLPPPTSIKKNFKRIVLTGITLCLILCVIFSFAACFFGGDDDADPTTPGQTEPETPSSDSDNSDNSNENDNDIWDDVIVPDDPVIDPDLPTDPDLPVDPDLPTDPEIPGEPEDPVINPDPSDPTDPINPGDGDTSDFPKSIYEVDEIDEINYFADAFVQILNETHMESLAKQFIGRNGTPDDIESTEWMITNSNNNDQIKELQVKVYYDTDTTRYFKVGQVTFNQAYSVQDIIKGNAADVTYSVAYNDTQAALRDIENNADLGKTVISTIDPDNTIEGDIWCSIGSPYALAGNIYRNIIVYQITNNKVLKFAIESLANGTSDPEIIQNNILNNKTNGSGIQSTEYTFTGMKIEQIPLPEEA